MVQNLAQAVLGNSRQSRNTSKIGSARESVQYRKEFSIIKKIMDLDIQTVRLMYLPTEKVSQAIVGISIKALHESFLQKKYELVNTEIE